MLGGVGRCAGGIEMRGAVPEAKGGRSGIGDGRLTGASSTAVVALAGVSAACAVSTAAFAFACLVSAVFGPSAFAGASVTGCSNRFFCT